MASAPSWMMRKLVALVLCSVGCASEMEDPDGVGVETAAHTTERAGSIAWRRDATWPITWVAAAPDGDTIVGGTYGTPLLFAGGELETPGEERAGDVFLAKVDPYGDLVWLRGVGADQRD